MRKCTAINAALVLVFALSMAPSRAMAEASPQVLAGQHGSAPPSAVSTPGSPLQMPVETWLVTWHATATGHLERTLDSGRIVADDSISMDGSSVTRYYTSTLSSYVVSQPFRQTVSHEFLRKDTFDKECGRVVETTQLSLLDSGGALPSEQTEYVVPFVTLQPARRAWPARRRWAPGFPKWT